MTQCLSFPDGVQLWSWPCSLRPADTRGLFWLVPNDTPMCQCKRNHVAIKIHRESFADQKCSNWPLVGLTRAEAVVWCAKWLSVSFFRLKHLKMTQDGSLMTAPFTFHKFLNLQISFWRKQTESPLKGDSKMESLLCLSAVTAKSGTQDLSNSGPDNSWWHNLE